MNEDSIFDDAAAEEAGVGEDFPENPFDDSAPDVPDEDVDAEIREYVEEKKYVQWGNKGS